MNSTRCPRCKKFPSLAELVSKQPHVCPPAWLCRFDWMRPDDEQRVYASAPEEAAQEYVYDYDGFTLSFHDHEIVLVYSALSGEGVSFEVDGELIRSYMARDKKLIETHPNFAERGEEE